MKIVKIRPKKLSKRIKAAFALYTVVFAPGESSGQDYSFDAYCNVFCKYGIKGCRSQCSEDGEYGRLLHIWEQQGYLIDFFTEHVDILTKEWGLSVKDAIMHHHANLIMAKKAIATGDLSKLFVPLHDDSGAKCSERKCVAKFLNTGSNNWIRIYAVRFQEEDGRVNYIITGGAIMLSKESARSSCDEEEKKQETVINYLNNNGYTSRDQIERVVFQARKGV